VDLSGFGLKSIQTTGNIAAGSKQLTLTASAEFSAGDQLIVAVGGESGAGQRGTVGVGGTWPALSFSSLSAMNADTSEPSGLYAWVTATGDVYQWQGPSWVSNVSAGSLYYMAKAVPRALVATVTAVDGSGAVLTLNRAASTDATNANVYYDNWSAFNAVLGDNRDSRTNVTVQIPAGTFAV